MNALHPRRQAQSRDDRQLRLQLRDIVALLALPALWRGQQPETVASNFVDVVRSLLRLDFVYLHLADAEGGPTIEARRPHDSGSNPEASLSPAHPGALEVDSQLNAGAEPLEAEGLRLIRLPLGPINGGGRLLAGSRRPDFPSEHERFLLRVALDQATIAIHSARLLRQERLARAEAEAAVRAREEFLSIASHELRNPIAGITGAAQMLQRARARGKLDDARLDRYLTIIGQTSARLAVLMEDLLDVSRLQGGQMPLRRRPTELRTLVREAVARQQLQTSSHRFSVVTESVGSLQIDPDRIEQVVTNLLDNAVKYSPGGGAIRIELRRDGEGAALCVRDSGIGLPGEALERIFQPFGRAANAAAQHIPGLGLGLYICRQIVEQHGGRLWAESPGEGQGTTMTLWLPSAEPVAAHEPVDA